MIKDPSHTEITAYELLDLPFDVSLSELRNALKRFMQEQGRKRPDLLGKAQQAHKKLQSPAGRAELDIWLYDVSCGASADVPKVALDLDEFSRPRAVAASALYNALAEVDHDAPRRQITPQKVRYSDVRCFDSIESLRFKPEFDR